MPYFVSKMYVSNMNFFLYLHLVFFKNKYVCCRLTNVLKHHAKGTWNMVIVCTYINNYFLPGGFKQGKIKKANTVPSVDNIICLWLLPS